MSDRSPQPRQRGWIPRRCGFWVSGPAVVLSVLAEGVYSLVAGAIFVATRRRQREKFIGILARGAGIVLLCATVAPLLVSCNSTQPGSSFQHHSEQLSDGIEVVFRMNYTGREAAEDFRTIFVGDDQDLSLDPLCDTIELLGW